MPGGRDEGPRAEVAAEGRIRVQGGRTAVAGTVRPGGQCDWSTAGLSLICTGYIGRLSADLVENITRSH